MKRKFGFVGSVVVATLASAVSVACGSTAEPPASSTGTVAAPAPTTPPPTVADYFQLGDVALYQGSKVSLATDGVLAESFNAPIIAGRPALVRVTATPLTTNLEVPLEAELHITRPDAEEVVLKATLPQLYKTPREGVLPTTLNFEVPAEALVVGTQLSVKIGASSVAADALTFPADGTTLDLDVKADAPTLHVKLVPITYDTDGSGRVPDLSDTSDYEEALYKMYPVANIDISIREPYKWSSEVAPTGDGWGDLLSGILQLRRADNVSPDVYYVGVFNPKPSLGSFCAHGGCVLGIAPASDGSEVGLRGALVLGYKSRMAGGTLAQELAHTMGRKHAPCGEPQAIDRKFPYKDGGIGSFGYDIVGKELIDPNDYSDFMSYCSPVWVSDYTFAGIYQRMSLVAKQAAAASSSPTPGDGTKTPAGGVPGPGAQRQERMLLQIEPDGTVKQAGLIEVFDDEKASADDGRAETMAVGFEGVGGRLLSTVTGKVRELSNTGSKFVLVPRPERGVVRARLVDRVVDVRAVAKR